MKEMSHLANSGRRLSEPSMRLRDHQSDRINDRAKASECNSKSHRGTFATASAIAIKGRRDPGTLIPGTSALLLGRSRKSRKPLYRHPNSAPASSIALSRTVCSAVPMALAIRMRHPNCRYGILDPARLRFEIAETPPRLG